VGSPSASCVVVEETSLCSFLVTCFSFLGMELFEEALRRWEQALTFRSRQAEDEACSSVKLGAGDAIAEESVDVRTAC
jgi:hypothetical protein